MATDSTGGIQFPPVEAILEPAGAAVTFDGMAPPLLTFLVQLGYIHFLLFGSALGVIKAVDGTHCPYEQHQAGRAVDLYFKELTDEERALFLAIINFAAPHQGCEVATWLISPHLPYVHLEYRGV